MDISEWFFFVLICFLGAFSPGPSFLIIVHNTLAYGRNAGYISSFGHACGIFLYALVACFFLEFLINFNSNFYYFLRILAVFYLILTNIHLATYRFHPSIPNNFYHAIWSFSRTNADRSGSRIYNTLRFGSPCGMKRGIRWTILRDNSIPGAQLTLADTTYFQCQQWVDRRK